MRVLAVALSLIMLAGGSLGQSSTATDSSATISTATPELPDDQTFAQYQRIAPGIKPPKALHSPDPKYPDLPPGAEPRGTVVMLVGISPKGHVEAVRVLRSDEQVFEKSAVDTVKKWKFKPAEQNGQHVPVQITVEMRFQR